MANDNFKQINAAEKLHSEIEQDLTVSGIFPKVGLIGLILGKKRAANVKIFRAKFGVEWQFWRLVLQRILLQSKNRKVIFVVEKLIILGDSI